MPKKKPHSGEVEMNMTCVAEPLFNPEVENKGIVTLAMFATGVEVGSEHLPCDQANIVPNGWMQFYQRLNKDIQSSTHLEVRVYQRGVVWAGFHVENMTKKIDKAEFCKEIASACENLPGIEMKHRDGDGWFAAGFKKDMEGACVAELYAFAAEKLAQMYPIIKPIVEKYEKSLAAAV